MFARAIAGEFPSGSTFKPFVAYAALADGIIREHSSFISTGGIRINEWFFPDWRSGGHGITDVRKAISDSVNTFFYIIGGGFDKTVGLGVEKITKYARSFGFGETTNLGLIGESDGFLPSKEWKIDAKGERWYVGDTYHLSIGQGDFLTTPLQMAVATSVIANDGFKLQPYLIQSIDGPVAYDLQDNNREIIQDLDHDALRIVKEGMRKTVTEGSARSLSWIPINISGKTGTAQTPGDRPYHSWFTGFAPFNNPEITLVVLVEEGGESNEAAVPLASRIGKIL